MKIKKYIKVLYQKEAIIKTHEFCLERNLAYYFEGNDYIYVLNKDNPKHIEFKNNWGMKDKVIVDSLMLMK